MPKSPQFDIELPEESDSYVPPDIWAKLLQRKWLLKLIWAMFVLAIFVVGASTNAWEFAEYFVP